MNYLLGFNRTHSSNQSAMEFLQKYEIAFEFVDLATITPEVLYFLLRNCDTGLTGLLKSGTYKQLESLSLSSAVKKIMASPRTFLRDTYLVSENEKKVTLFVGFKTDDYRALISKEKRKAMLELAIEREGELLV